MDRDPMVGSAPREVPLPAAPLIRVLVQVRFPAILKIEQDNGFVAEFQEAIRERYPFLTHEKGQQVTLSPAQPVQVEFSSPSVWRFADAPKEWGWRVALGADFLTLETSAYRSRVDFIARLSGLLTAAERTLRPGPVTRIGVRYVDRLIGPALDGINGLLDPSILGVMLTPLREHAQASLGETLLTAPEEEASLRLRFGFLPAGATTEPTAIPPINEPSWVLDLDMFDETQRVFTTAVIEGRVRAFAERIYGVFRSLVTPAFLEHYGASR